MSSGLNGDPALVAAGDTQPDEHDPPSRLYLKDRPVSVSIEHDHAFLLRIDCHVACNTQWLGELVGAFRHNNTAADAADNRRVELAHRAHPLKARRKRGVQR